MGKTLTDAQKKQEDAAYEGFDMLGFDKNIPLIYQLIGKAMAEIQAIGKSGEATNYAGKKMYNFRGIDQVYNAMNPVMSKYGLFIIPEVLEHTREERTSSNNNTLLYSILKIRFTMYAPDGSYVQSVLMGEGMDSGDKAINKAMSIAMKYFCFQVFMIPTEEMKNDDQDNQVHDVKPKGQPKQNQAAQQKAAPASRKDAPAQVTTQPQLPAQEKDPVQEFIKNEIAFMSQRLEISNENEMLVKFANMKKTLEDSGAISFKKKTKDMSMDEAKVLVDAMYVNFFEDKKEETAS